MAEKDQLYIHALGGLSMELNGKRVEGNFRDHSQFTLLLMTIVHFRNSGVERNFLINTIFGDQQLDDVSHSLRNSLYLAKKKMGELGFPDANYFYKEKNVYYWDDQVEVVEDAEEFEKAYYQAVREQNLEDLLEKMMEAVNCYTGSFLPQFQNVEWVREEADRYLGMFRRCIRDIDQFATKLSRYQDLYRISMYAAKVDPYASWEALGLKALIGMDLYEEAEAFYNQTLETYIAKFGSRTAKAVRDVVDEMGKYMMYQLEDISQIHKRLTSHKESTSGGFICSFPVFQELYRSVERVMERFGGYIYLLLCTVVDGEGNPLGDSTELEPVYDRLMESLAHSVRHSDTITRYGKGQFLVLLLGTTEDNCDIIKERIDADFAGALEAGISEDEVDRKYADVTVEYSIQKVIAEHPHSFPFFENLQHEE